MTLRVANIDDVVEVDRINRLVLPENYPIDFWRKIMCATIASNFVIKHDDEIVAYIIGAIEKDNLQRLKGHVYSIGVLPEYTRKGYGKRMIEAFEADCKNRFNITKVTLHVRKTNKSAITFYNNCGYQRMKKVKQYYGEGEDGFLFEKMIES
jgi:ribosomal protein S18 acetylase RimI-like enzyme